VAIALVIDNPEGSQEIYEKVRAQLGLEGAAGGIFHVAVARLHEVALKLAQPAERSTSSRPRLR
jgi:hypothetical protein